MYEMTPREFQNYVIGFRKAQFENIKTQMMMFRDLEFCFISPYLDKKHNIKKPTDYKSFFWEKEVDNTKRKFKTKEELAKAFEGLDEEK